MDASFRSKMQKRRPKPQAQISAERMKSAVLAVGFEIGAHGWRERRYVLNTVTLLCLRHDPTLDSAAGGEVSSVFDVQRMTSSGDADGSDRCAGGQRSFPSKEQITSFAPKLDKRGAGVDGRQSRPVFGAQFAQNRWPGPAGGILRARQTQAAKAS